MEASEANSIMLRLRHLLKNLKELDKKFGQLAVNTQVCRTNSKNRSRHYPGRNKEFLISIHLAMERLTRTNSKGVTFGDDSRVEGA